MLEIKYLHAKSDDKEILKGVNLKVNKGEIHAIMGPNGSGKSTLASIIAGKPGYEITKGEIIFEDSNLSSLSPEERSHQGIFLAFQYPIEIPGVSNLEFLKATYNEKLKAEGKDPINTIAFKKLLNEKLNSLSLSKDWADKNLNFGLSGGEKKRNEILQMAVLDPKLKLLDETDSGLDVDALKLVAKGIKDLHSKDSASVLITHYNRILEFLNVDYVHIMVDGKIVKSGDASLALEIEKEGYDKYLQKPKLNIIN